MRTTRLLAAAILAAGFACPAGAQDRSQMTFFVTSAHPGQGGNFGGLAGADAYCQRLAAAAGAGSRTWRAYLSAQAAGGQPAANARDRIGQGPWRNASGVVVARDLAHLHDDPNINKQTALTERGDVVSGRGDPVNNHDILTGSDAQGRAIAGDQDTTCRNWTSATDGAAMTGHHDRIGLRDDAASRSWNASHPSRGCSLELLRTTGGAGLIYCFAID
jgi:hypothetical protein